jgi:3-oxoacyl-[acyl-carrier-protein] synthase II
MFSLLHSPCLHPCLHDVLDNYALMCSVRINSSKSMIGHLLGGASGVEGVATVLSVYHQRMHPNINLDSPEEGVDMDLLVGAEAQDREIEVALSNSFGFGGHNSVVAFRRWRE